MTLDYRMYILVNEDIKISKGKLAGQVGHAVATYFWKAFGDIQGRAGYEKLQILKEYMNNAQKKIILKCSQLKLEELESEGFIVIRDKGYTQLEPNTLTCVNYGIMTPEAAPDWIKELKLYN